MTSKFNGNRIRPSHVCRKPIPGNPQPPPAPPDTIWVAISFRAAAIPDLADFQLYGLATVEPSGTLWSLEGRTALDTYARITLGFSPGNPAWQAYLVAVGYAPTNIPLRWNNYSLKDPTFWAAWEADANETWYTYSGRLSFTP